MTGRPLVSVILTTYNQGKWLGTAIDSVFAQTYQGWELVLVDNGSTDETAEVIARYRLDPRVKVTSYRHNQKHTVVSNAAIAMSRGEYIAFLYGDDYYLPEKLERQLAVFAANGGAGVVYCKTYRLADRSGTLAPVPFRPCRGHILKEVITAQPFSPVAPMIRRECWSRYPFNEELFMEGESLFTKIAMTYTFDFVDAFLCVMRDHDANMGKEIGPSLERNVIIFKALFGHPDFPLDYMYLEAPTLAWIHRMKGWQAIRTMRNYEQGRTWLLTAIHYEKRSMAEVRVALGLSLAVLPRALSNRVLDVADRVFGRPPRPPEFSGV